VPYRFQSDLDIFSDGIGEYAWFHGTLDTKTLSGVGFASQKTSTRSETWDLSGTNGVFLDLRATDGNHLASPRSFVTRGSGKQYTLTVSNELPQKRPDGRDVSTVLYEYSFNTRKPVP